MASTPILLIACARASSSLGLQCSHCRAESKTESVVCVRKFSPEMMVRTSLPSSWSFARSCMNMSSDYVIRSQNTPSQSNVGTGQASRISLLPPERCLHIPATSSYFIVHIQHHKFWHAIMEGRDERPDQRTLDGTLRASSQGARSGEALRTCRRD